MGGDIRVESQEGAGATFTFHILVEKGLSTFRDGSALPLIPAKDKTILVVDDNNTNRTILHRLLLQWELRPLLAATGSEALALLEREAVDLVITDLDMPEMDGIELAETIRARGKTVPILLLSSVGNETRRKYPDLFQAVMNKPVKHNQLLKHIAMLLQGRVAAEAAGEVVGSEVSEVSTSPGASGEQKLSESFADSYPMRILIAEDNIVNQHLILHILNKLGYTPEIVGNGQEAVAMLAEQEFDVVMMDVQMPVMDGLEATQAIRERYAAAPVIIALTADAQEEDRQRCLAAGMNDYISKPLQIDKLIELLKKWSKRPINIAGR
jgi:CheY-like chemotaxis protein